MSASQIPPDSFRTARLLLRRPRREDAPGLFASYVRDAEVTRYLRWRPHQELSESEAIIESFLQKWDGGSEFIWFLFTQADSVLIGSIAARMKPGEVELGYVIARAFWGRGLMREAIEAVAGWAFTQSGISRVTAACDMENKASARLLEKAGFRREGILEKFSVHPNISAEPRDCYLYEKLREE